MPIRRSLPAGPEPIAAMDDRLVATWRRGLTAVDRRTWLRAAMFGIIAATLIAVPTRLVPNGFFSRMTPTRPLDYVFLVVSSTLVGLSLALSSVSTDRGGARPARSSAGAPAAGPRAVISGMATVFAVGCPVCNKLVVAVLGTGGALSVFAPLQPLIGLAAAGLLVIGLTGQLRALTTTCSRTTEGHHHRG